MALALELENIAAETYVSDTSKARLRQNRALFASIMGVEAQHVAVLLAVQALLKAGAPSSSPCRPQPPASCRPPPATWPSPTPSTRPTTPPRPTKEQSSEKAPPSSSLASEAEIVERTRDLDALHHDVAKPAMEEVWRSGPTGSAPIAAAHQPPHCSCWDPVRPGQHRGHGRHGRGPRSGRGRRVAPERRGAGTNPEAGLTATWRWRPWLPAWRTSPSTPTGPPSGRSRAGKLGTVPPAIGQFATTAKTQHADHAAAWNSLLTAAGKRKVTVTDPTLTPTVRRSSPR